MDVYRVTVTNGFGFVATTVTAESADNADDIATRAMESDKWCGWHVTDVTAL